ncbi:hypothetical protein D9757_005058 [Collybiopsis confluens]|uniref:Mid2 domain-containing protein n=1 Tax=Collybiopsis confluens TaxID=2823264 RepID=A0A8H5MCT6_9AGAR|nr:hypothetical protein D9757_005058 [Collybiopsis confluens]
MHCAPIRSLLILSLPIFTVALSRAANRSIDDTLGDSVTGQKPLFLPLTQGVWADATCGSICAIRPPTQDAFDQTYTAATYNPTLGSISIVLSFTGTAIYVFFILANAPASGVAATTTANFTLDGLFRATYDHSPDPNAPAFQFNESALAFSQSGLENGTHSLLISTSGLNESIFVNFDYALYTFEEEDDTPAPSFSSTGLSSATGSPATSNTSKHSALNTGAIVGGIIGGVIALCALTAVMFICYRQRRRKLHRDEAPAIIELEYPYISGSSISPPSPKPSMTYRFPNALTSRTIASSSPAPGTPEAELHQIRQQELQRQMRAIQEEMEELQNEARLGDQQRGSQGANNNSSELALYSQAGLPIPSRSSKFRRNRSTNETVDVQRLKDQIRAMTEQLEFLQSQQNEPPPGYSSYTS